MNAGTDEARFGDAIDLRTASKFLAACMMILVPMFIAALVTMQLVPGTGALEAGAV